MLGCSFFKKSKRRLQLSNRIAKILPDNRYTHKVTHKQQHMIKQRLLSLCAGYKDLNDQIT